MRFRKLPIAWSVLWGLACILLIVLWLRSYWCVDDIGGRFAHIAFQAVSVRARLVNSFALVPPSEGGPSCEVISEPDNNTEGHDADLSEMTNKFGFGFFHDPSTTIIVPHWFAAFIAATLVAMPWLRWSNRFSLRTLLIATTLVAVGLGLIVYFRT